MNSFPDRAANTTVTAIQRVARQEGPLTDSSHEAAVLDLVDGDVVIVHTRGVRVDALEVATAAKIIVKVVLHTIACALAAISAVVALTKLRAKHDETQGRARARPKKILAYFC